MPFLRSVILISLFISSLLCLLTSLIYSKSLNSCILSLLLITLFSSSISSLLARYPFSILNLFPFFYINTKNLVDLAKGDLDINLRSLFRLGVFDEVLIIYTKIWVIRLRRYLKECLSGKF